MFKNNENNFIESSIIKFDTTEKTNKYNQNGLKKLNEEVIDSIMNFNDNDIEKIERKLSRVKNQEFFIRENQIHKIEKEKDNIKRKMEMEINSKKIKIFNDKIKKYKFKIRKEKRKCFIKFVILIIIVTGPFAISIILLDKYL